MPCVFPITTYSMFKKIDGVVLDRKKCLCKFDKLGSDNRCLVNLWSKIKKNMQIVAEYSQWTDNEP